MAEFIMKYTRTYERKVEAETLKDAAAHAKRVCDSVPDCRLLSVIDPNFKPAEAA